MSTYDVVIPTVGRASIAGLLESLSDTDAKPTRVVIVDDTVDGTDLSETIPPSLAPLVRVMRSGGAGPAAARNLGWRAGSSPWVVFLDDDVVPDSTWGRDLAGDLAGAAPITAAVSANIVVPVPDRPDDWTRNVARLAEGDWITADVAVRRWALELTGGFDERFPRAYREDTDLALRIRDLGLGLARGTRRSAHPVQPAPWHVSLGRQRGNTDDALMTALHGIGWQARARVPRGSRRSHLLTTALLVAAASERVRRPTLALWALATARFAWRRVAPGPRTPVEVAAMVLTSVLIPPLAVWWWVVGWVRVPSLMRRDARVRLVEPDGPVAAVIFDRDDTLIVDVPYNDDPAKVEAMPGAAEAVDRLREAGVALAVATNQSGIGRGLLSEGAVAAVNRRIDDLMGPFDAWAVCPHSPTHGCACRKPSPGMLVDVAHRVDVEPANCVFVGDIGSDMEAARAAGMFGVLVPTARTLPAEVQDAPCVAADLHAVADLLGRHVEARA